MLGLARIHLVPEKQKLSFSLFRRHCRHTAVDPGRQAMWWGALDLGIIKCSRRENCGSERFDCAKGHTAPHRVENKTESESRPFCLHMASPSSWRKECVIRPQGRARTKPGGCPGPSPLTVLSPRNRHSITCALCWRRRCQLALFDAALFYQILSLL